MLVTTISNVLKQLDLIDKLKFDILQQDIPSERFMLPVCQEKLS